MFRVRYLEIRRFRGLARPVRLEFGERYHLVVGDNGGGKTNLLKLLAMVTRLDFSDLRNESFDLSWGARTDAGLMLEGRVFRELVESSPAGETFAGLPGQARWDWQLVVEGETPREWRGKGTGVAGATGDPAGEFGLLIALVGERVEDPSPLRWALGGFSRRADEALGTLHALTGTPRAGVEASDVEDLVVSVFMPGAASDVQGAVAGPYPRAAPEVVQRWAGRASSGDAEPISHEHIPFLARAVLDFAAHSAHLRPRRGERRPINPEKPARGDWIRFLGSDIEVRLSEHVTTHHDRLSFGQKRLLGLRYYLSTVPNAPAIIDELSNGLHHAWVESILRDLEAQQSFLATQNPLVMDGVWWESADEARRGIILCTRDADHRWSWRQLDQEESERFYRAWTAGVQQIHEVLKTERWW